MSNDKLWHTKLAARLHDPGEKALVLLRDPAGHEGGTVRILNEWLDLDLADRRAVKRADWWAAAADRPQWPKDQWAQVRWTRDPVLIHPISGTEIDLRDHGRLTDTDIEDIKARSLEHFKSLAEAVDSDPRRTLLAYWRFGPELREDEDFGKLGPLWGQLPADTRVPDHSIWEHLDLTSAFAGAAAADERGEVALLAMAIGPVQPFIASARTTSDLWAGSHLLARLAWEAMKPVCEELGPDAVLFPRLRGVPQVDLWLREQGLPEALFGNAPWQHGASDANPLFAAALPNRFVAVVPASKARELADRCEREAREWLQEKGETVVKQLLEVAGESKDDATLYCLEQMRRQLDGFPEVHWAAVPFTLIATEGEKARDDQPVLSAAMEPFFGQQNGGFLSSPAWQVLKQEIQLEQGVPFLRPNPGVLYPAIYELAERVLAAAKSVRAFEQMDEQGWRCSLTGEREWLTTDKSQLSIPPGSRRDTLWTKVAAKKPSWAKKGEHLGGLAALKRVWPDLFAADVAQALGLEKEQVPRFAVSTHTMALARNLQALHKTLMDKDAAKAFDGLVIDEDRAPALPRALARLRGSLAARIPAALDRLRESEDREDEQRLRDLESVLKRMLGFKPEAYYGLLLMDGDRMGAILSGELDEKDFERQQKPPVITYLEGFHPTVRKAFEARMADNARLRDYGEQRRPPSPGRHMAVSGALNDFALHVVPHVVEEAHLGKLIYAGGDDVMAMLPVADLLPAAALLREAYSGRGEDRIEDLKSKEKRLLLGNGYTLLGGRLMRMMGERATASAGLVVAHHQTPLSRVLREARAAEQTAKEAGGRDALCLRILKRSGGALEVVLKWRHIDTFRQLIDFLRDPAVSRRAVYHSIQWLRDLPEPEGDGAMLAELLAFQFQRQGGDKGKAQELAGTLTDLCLQQPAGTRRGWLENLLSSAEFLARETRATPVHATAPTRQGGEAA